MRSETFTSLLQFINKLGLDPWLFAGIDKTGTLQKQAGKDKCSCFLQHPWDTQAEMSRDEFIKFISHAERFFIDESGVYPTRYQILDEQKKYLPSIRPQFGCYIQDFGILQYTNKQTVVLTKGAPDDNFTATFTVGINTELCDILAYFTETDGGYALGDFNDNKIYQIRPVTLTVTAIDEILETKDILLTAPAYLFKKPSLDEATDCLPHVLETYVDEIDIYEMVLNRCLSGNFICEKDCGGVPCEPTLKALCMSKRKRGNIIYGVPHALECNEEQEQVAYCLTCYPTEVSYNYVTGNCTMDSRTLDAIFKLSWAFADCVRDGCKCDVCSNDIISYYRNVPKEKIVDRSDAIGDTYQLIMTPKMIEQLGGLPPNRGLFFGIQDMRAISCKYVEGGR